jgi:hypothetical protein
MCQNEAYILASEVGGWTFSAGPNNWRVIKRIDRFTIRIFFTRSAWEDKAYMGGAYAA